ncbi:hypothetical protein HPP92_024997 [Vanilla planifolia]|uniref:Glucan endo-1,3-beta-D-glucosidase n=1 Tax=Vanilla planifolia TaxID=51239 RepID=A0A835U8I4_VANPL|nr:hypothetical protein HPP92_024997 [Vanilla planifolia]
MESGFLLCFATFALLLPFFSFLAEAQGIGVNYGMKGDNLPSPSEVISLYKSRNITKLRLFFPDKEALDVLRGSGIGVILGAYNEDLPQLAENASFATSWVNESVIPYATSVEFRYIDIGNELIPGDSASYVLPAMRNVDAALRNAGVAIPVTTAVSTEVLDTSYPPSQGAFSDDVSQVLTDIVGFLSAKEAPLLVNVYPFFAYAGDPGEVRLDYALFTSGGVVVQDGSLGYSNLFDAMVDSVNAALERAGGGAVEVVVSETGWPSAGGDAGATVDNASTYINNLVKHVKSKAGTPRFPGKEPEVYLFAMFNEDLKPAGTERNFGMYYPDMSEVYHVSF